IPANIAANARCDWTYQPRKVAKASRTGENRSADGLLLTMTPDHATIPRNRKCRLRSRAYRLKPYKESGYSGNAMSSEKSVRTKRATWKSGAYTHAVAASRPALAPKRYSASKNINTAEATIATIAARLNEVTESNPSSRHTSAA